jgi:hypothetical protein
MYIVSSSASTIHLHTYCARNGQSVGVNDQVLSGDCQMAAAPGGNSLFDVLRHQSSQGDS